MRARVLSARGGWFLALLKRELRCPGGNSYKEEQRIIRHMRDYFVRS
jgi:hypothetical protein